MEAAIIYLDQIPSAFVGLIGTLIASILLLIGSIITLILQRSNQDNERKLVTRKQVYFDTCEALANIQAGLITIPQRQMKDNVVDPQLTASLMRLHLMGGLKLVKNLMEFQRVQMIITLDLGLKKAEIEAIESQCAHARESRETFMGYQKDLWEKQQQTSNKNEYAQLEVFINEWKERIQKCDDFLAENDPKLDQLRAEIFEETLMKTLRLAEPATKCMVEMRKELGLRFNIFEKNEYLKECNEGRKYAEEMMTKFIVIAKPKIANFQWPDFLNLNK